MAIDYTRRPASGRPSDSASGGTGSGPSVSPSPASGAAPGGGPSWYRPPEDGEKEAGAAEPTASPPYPPPAPAQPQAPGSPAWPPAAGQSPHQPAWPPLAEGSPTGTRHGEPWPPPSGSPAAQPHPRSEAAAYPPPSPSYPPTEPPAYPPPAQPPWPAPAAPAPGGYGPPTPGSPGVAGYPAPGGAYPATPPPPAPGGYQAPPPTGSPSAPAAATGGVKLSKLTLTKAAPQVSLSKSGGVGGVMRVNLNWSARPQSSSPRGFFKRLAGDAGGSIDLDLGCLYEMADGSKGVVQALGNSFGSLQARPFIQLDGDDRSGNSAGGENMSINLGQPGRFRRILIFALIYEGVPNWAAADGVVTLTPISGPQIEVRLDATSDQARICAVAQIIEQHGELIVQREVHYINGGQSALDRAYGWGMNWTPGRK